jgi:glycosyltransferase involved in cell wall biosynthesis
MKVLVVHNRYRSGEPSGEDRVVDQENLALVEAGHDVIQFERYSDEIKQFSLLRKALIPAGVVWNPAAGHELGQTLNSLRPDVVHVHNLFPLLGPSLLQACNRRRIPVVATLHNGRLLCAEGSFFRAGSPCYKCLGHLPFAGIQHGCYRGSRVASTPMALASAVHRPAWRSALSAYIFVSGAQRRLFSALEFPPARCFVKWHFVATRPRQTKAEDLVVFTGRLSVAKGLRLLMEAWDQFEAARPGGPLRLAIAGAGELDGEVRRWAADRPSVEVLGMLSGQECATLVSRARAAIVPSAGPETFGLAVAEAKAAGVAPIAAAHGAFPELISDGVDGLLFPPGDREALARLLGKVESSAGWFDDLGIAAHEAAKRQFDPAANLAQLESIYTFAAANPRWRESRPSTSSSDSELLADVDSALLSSATDPTPAVPEFD